MACDWLGLRTRVPEKWWQCIEPLLPKYSRSPHGGRPRMPLRHVVDGI